MELLVWFIAGGHAACVPLHGQTLAGTEICCREEWCFGCCLFQVTLLPQQQPLCHRGCGWEWCSSAGTDLAMMERKQSQSHECELLLKEQGARTSRITRMREGSFLTGTAQGHSGQ